LGPEAEAKQTSIATRFPARLPAWSQLHSLVLVAVLIFQTATPRTYGLDRPSISSKDLVQSLAEVPFPAAVDVVHIQSHLQFAFRLSTALLNAVVLVCREDPLLLRRPQGLFLACLNSTRLPWRCGVNSALAVGTPSVMNNPSALIVEAKLIVRLSRPRERSRSGSFETHLVRRDVVSTLFTIARLPAATRSCKLKLMPSNVPPCAMFPGRTLSKLAFCTRTFR